VLLSVMLCYCLTNQSDVVLALFRSGLDLRHGPPAYESDMLPGKLTYSEDGMKTRCILEFALMIDNICFSFTNHN